MRCPTCHKDVLFERIGATIGGTQLISCPECNVVVVDRPKKRATSMMHYTPYDLERAPTPSIPIPQPVPKPDNEFEKPVG